MKDSSKVLSEALINGANRVCANLPEDSALVIENSHFNIKVQKISKAKLEKGVSNKLKAVTTTTNGRLLAASSSDVIKIDMDYDQKVFAEFKTVVFKTIVMDQSSMKGTLVRQQNRAVGKANFLSNVFMIEAQSASEPIATSDTYNL
jgi:hypothetical protein